MSSTAWLAIALTFGPEPAIDPDLQAALAVIQHQTENIRSLNVRFTLDIDYTNPNTKPFRQFQTHQQIRQGHRYRVDRDLLMDASRPAEAEDELFAFDGEIHQSADQARGTGVVSTTGAAPINLMQNLYLSNGSLDAMLKEYAPVAEVNWTEWDGRKLLEVRYVETIGSARRTLYLDPVKAYQPRRFTVEFDCPLGTFPDGRIASHYAEVVNDFLEQDGVTLPRTVKVIHDAVYADERKHRMWIKVTKIESLEINRDYPNETFTIDYPKGTLLTDMDRRVRYIVGEPGSEVSIDAPQPVPAVAAVAGPHYEFWSDWRIWVAFSAVCLALLIWAKRRGWAS